MARRSIAALTGIGIVLLLVAVISRGRRRRGHTSWSRIVGAATRGCRFPRCYRATIYTRVGSGARIVFPADTIIHLSGRRLIVGHIFRGFPLDTYLPLRSVRHPGRTVGTRAIIGVVNGRHRIVGVAIPPGGWAVEVGVTTTVETATIKATSVEAAPIEIRPKGVEAKIKIIARAPRIPWVVTPSRIPGAPGVITKSAAVPRIPPVPSVPAIPAPVGIEIIIDQHGHARREEGVVIVPVNIYRVKITEPVIRTVETANTGRIVIVIVIVIMAVFSIVIALVIIGDVVVIATTPIIIVTVVVFTIDIRIVVQVVILPEGIGAHTSNKESDQKYGQSIAFHKGSF